MDREVRGAQVPEPASVVDREQAHLRAAPLVAVADHDHPVALHQHFVVPLRRLGAVRVGIHRRDRPELARAHRDGEEPPAPEHHQVVAVQLDDAALVDAGVLRVGDRFVAVRHGRRHGRLHAVRGQGFLELDRARGQLEVRTGRSAAEGDVADGPAIPDESGGDPHLGPIRKGTVRQHQLVIAVGGRDRAPAQRVDLGVRDRAPCRIADAAGDDDPRVAGRQPGRVRAGAVHLGLTRRPGPVEHCQILQQLGVRAERPHGAAWVLGMEQRERGREEQGAEQKERGLGPHGSGLVTGGHAGADNGRGCPSGGFRHHIPESAGCHPSSRAQRGTLPGRARNIGGEGRSHPTGEALLRGPKYHTRSSSAVRRFR